MREDKRYIDYSEEELHDHYMCPKCFTEVKDQTKSEQGLIECECSHKFATEDLLSVFDIAVILQNLRNTKVYGFFNFPPCRVCYRPTLVRNDSHGSCENNHVYEVDEFISNEIL